MKESLLAADAHMKKHGNLPTVLGHFPIEFSEACFYLYMPINMERNGSALNALPSRLMPFVPLLAKIQRDEPIRFFNEVVYLTVKHMFVSHEVSANRPGWHSDGFGTNDLNYVWYDSLPTVFNNSDFEVSGDHLLSLDQFEQQALPANDVRYPTHTLLKLDQSVIHRVGEVEVPGWRTFVKVSISPNHYNLSGNTRNYALDYDWPLFNREAIRNDPYRAQLDSVKP